MTDNKDDKEILENEKIILLRMREEISRKRKGEFMRLKLNDKYHIVFTNDGFCLWHTERHQWIIDASTIINKNSFEVASEHDGYCFKIENNNNSNHLYKTT